MTHVIKKSGEKELFDPAKVKRSVQKALIDAGEEPNTETVDLIVNKMQEISDLGGEVETSAIRTMILDEFDRMDSDAAGVWRKFDRKYKVNSKEGE